MRILVLDGHQNQAVASVRSLAKAGHEVLVGESAAWSKAAWSRSAAGHFQYPAPHGNVEAFVETLARHVSQVPGTLVLPMTEATTLPISRHREVLLAAGARLVLPDHQDLLRAFNKDESARLAASLGIKVPNTVVVTSLEQARDVAHSAVYPVVLKPRASEEIGAEGAVRTGGRPRYASTPEQLESSYRDISARSRAVLVQEFIRGDGVGYFALLNHGELRAEFAHRRIRDVHPTGSGSSLRESAVPDERVRKDSLALLGALHWHGVAMVEFRRSAGVPVFIEVNGRFWNSLALACYAGVDFPALLAQMAEHGDVPRIDKYKTGVRCRWFLGDFRHVIEVFKGPPTGYPDSYPSRWRTLRQVLAPAPGTYHDLFQWRDPLPELGDWINIVGRLAATRTAKGRRK
jgi:predicted ATP-grasp superfamily ATP-dependent carboligase